MFPTTPATLTVCNDGMIETTIHTSPFSAYLRLISAVFGTHPENDYRQRVAKDARAILLNLDESDEPDMTPFLDYMQQAMDRLDLGHTYMVQTHRMHAVLIDDIRELRKHRPLLASLLSKTLPAKPVLDYELDAGEQAAAALARHVDAMGSAAFTGKQQIEGRTYVVHARILTPTEADADPLRTMMLVHPL